MRILILLAALFALAAPARAEVAAAAPDGFSISQNVDVAAAPDRVWRDLLRIGSWWEDTHTYSGAARNMTLEPRAGGCFCERWRGGEVEHARVVALLREERTLRLAGGLGPLQDMALEAALTYVVTAHEDGARISLTYNVNGSSLSNLAAVAPSVDRVLAIQLARLKRYAETGAPD